jgi:ubiquinone/menaquinone biosynthesis C-methylase UbiE
LSSVQQEKIQEHYDTVAETYDDHYDKYRGRKYHNHISSYLISALPENANLLDIGCGTGLFIEKYTRNGGTAVGLDISRRMLFQAKKRCASSAFTLGSGDRLPFRDDSFDAVSSLLVFSYVRNPQEMLNETYRVLRPGGSVAICTLGKKLITKGIPALYYLSEKMNVNHILMKNFGEHYFDENEMNDLFANAGFGEVSIRWCSFAHIDMADPIFHLAKKVEPFVERRIPQLAYNIFVSAKKPVR